MILQTHAMKCLLWRFNREGAKLIVIIIIIIKKKKEEKICLELEYMYVKTSSKLDTGVFISSRVC